MTTSSKIDDLAPAAAIKKQALRSGRKAIYRTPNLAKGPSLASIAAAPVPVSGVPSDS
jgi:hypothetical protein